MDLRLSKSPNVFIEYIFLKFPFQCCILNMFYFIVQKKDVSLIPGFPSDSPVPFDLAIVAHAFRAIYRGTLLI